MPELNFTPEQRAAIDTRGSTVLVSAAAGSGKTRVLTERLMAYLTDAENPVDIDRFLVITYTRAGCTVSCSGCSGRRPRAWSPPPPAARAAACAS